MKKNYDNQILNKNKMDIEKDINKELVRDLTVFSSENQTFFYLNNLVNKLSPDTVNEFKSAYRIYINDIPDLKLEDFIEYLSSKFNISDFVDNNVAYTNISDDNNSDVVPTISSDYENDGLGFNTYFSSNEKFIYNKDNTTY